MNITLFTSSFEAPCEFPLILSFVNAVKPDAPLGEKEVFFSFPCQIGLVSARHPQVCAPTADGQTERFTRVTPSENDRSTFSGFKATKRLKAEDYVEFLSFSQIRDVVIKMSAVWKRVYFRGKTGKMKPNYTVIILRGAWVALWP